MTCVLYIQQPYPNAGHDQFGFQWFILAMEIFVFFVIAILIMLPRTLLRLKHIAMAFLVYVFVLTTLQASSALYPFCVPQFQMCICSQGQ